MKECKIKNKDIKNLLKCIKKTKTIETDKTIYEGYKIGYMHRQIPNKDYLDSRWHHLPKKENPDYINNIENPGLYDLNTICAYDSEVIKSLDSQYQAEYYKDEAETLESTADTDIDEILSQINLYLKTHLSKERYQHSLRVMQKAIEYAKFYKQDINIIKLVALAHDIAKDFTKEENEQYIIENNLDKNLLLPENKYIIHGYIGADILEKEYNFTKEMADAVRYHTTLRKGMTTLDKLIYLADKTEDGRVYPNIEKERLLAFENLDKAIILALENGIEVTKKKGKKVNNLSQEAICYLKKKISK